VQVHRRQLDALRQWTQGLQLEGHQVSCHVLESGDVADALVQYARGNNVSLMVLGAATHGLKLQRLMATVPIRVAMQAPCSVMLVKQKLPFTQLAQPAAVLGEDDDAAATATPRSPLYMGPVE